MAAEFMRVKAELNDLRRYKADLAERLNQVTSTQIPGFAHGTKYSQAAYFSP